MKVLATAVVALVVAVLVVLSVASIGRSSDDIRLTSNTTPIPPVMIAAQCAGFPEAVAYDFGLRYKGNQAVSIKKLPARYEVTVVTVHQAGGCLTETVPNVPPGKAAEPLFLSPALGVLDVSDVLGEGLPLYVITEVKAPAGSVSRVFIALRLPKPERVQEIRERARIA